MTRAGTGPLDGVRVVDISTSYAGPVASMYLADMGADVIKVERPDGGDDARAWGPPFIAADSAWFHSANRNKRSVCIDLKAATGREVLSRLLASADVFIANLTSPKLERLGLAPATVVERFPRMIFCSLSGFGLDGPNASLPGYDLIAQAMSGMMSVTGARGSLPQRVSTALSDVAAGTVAAFAIAAALRRQALTGEGEIIDVALLDADLALMAPRIVSFLAGEPEPRPSGGTDSVLAIYQAFETADRPIVLAVGNDRLWARACEVLGLPELARDPELSSNAQRRARRAELVAEIARQLRGRPAAEWLADFARASVPAAPIQLLSEVVADGHVRARGSVRRLPGEGDDLGAEVVTAPWRLGSQDGEPPLRPAPRVGGDTVAVLGEVGYAGHEIDELLATGAVWTNTITAS